MGKPATPRPESEESNESTRFDRMVSALFRVDKRDVPKHQCTPRKAASSVRE